MGIKIIKPGILDTIQDLGRWGYQYLGVNPGGVMDRFAAQLGNAIVGNELGAAIIELHFPASQVLFESPALISITGADFGAMINETAIDLNHAIIVGANSQLHFSQKRKGERAYLAVKNIQTKKWLNSYSTNLKARAGGFEGRALRKNDIISTEDETEYLKLLAGKPFLVLPFRLDPGEISGSREILVLPGHEWDLLDEKQQAVFQSSIFTISKNADRMGYQLSGPAIQLIKTKELVSTGVSSGTIQLLPGGQLIILMAEHQATGGYPRIAHVLQSYVDQLAQMGPSAIFKFRITDQASAELLLVQRQQHLLQLENACKFRLDEFLS